MTLERDDRSPDDLDDTQAFEVLMSDARDGDEHAIGELLDQFRNYLLLVANDELAKDVQRKVGPSDIVQESLLAAQVHFARFNGNSPRELRAWLKGILRNGLNDAARRFKQIKKRQLSREQPLATESEAGPVIEDRFLTPGTHAVQREETQLLKESMESLSEDYQQVLKLRNWEQMSFEEIGKQMDRSADAVRKLWYRALLELQELHRKSD